jgi:hypothetical protein
MLIQQQLLLPVLHQELQVNQHTHRLIVHHHHQHQLAMHTIQDVVHHHHQHLQLLTMHLMNMHQVLLV